MLCRLRRHNMKEKRIVRGHLALRQGLCPIGANLRESSPPKWVMSPWRAPHVRLSLGCQASDRQGCRDALACDDHDTKNVVHAANTPESAHVYSCLGTVRHKRSKQASATIHSLSGPARASCHQEPQRTSRPTRCCSVQCTASRIACRTAVLSSSSNAHPSKSAVMVALATAIVVHRKVCSLSNGFMRLKSSSICQRA